MCKWLFPLGVLVDVVPPMCPVCVLASYQDNSQIKDI